MTPHERALTLVREQDALYAALEGLCARQRDAIEAGQTDELLAVLGERQGVIDEIVSVGEALGPLSAEWDRLVAEMPAEARGETQTLLGRIEGRMRSIAEHDEADQSSLRRHRETLSGVSAKARRTSGAVRAYGGSKPARGPRYEDRRA
ncbi:MAG: hypothetical protein AAF108_02205 [Planctomycetota bacterium]